MRRVFLILILGLLPLFLVAQTEWTPPKSDRLVNDYSGILTASEKAYLEHRLVAFADTTSNQIVIVITPTLHGDEIKAVGQRIGQQWGVGQSKYNNGLVILIKSKTAEEPAGEVAILTGYGFEGVFPDVFCRRIIDDKMMPYLAKSDYYGAINEALSVILPVAAGEYSYAQYKEDDGRDLTDAIICLVVFGILFFLFIRYLSKHGGGHGGSGSRHSSGPIWMSGFPTHGSGGFGGFSGGGSFGGFGGGSFGGGGASGRF